MTTPRPEWRPIEEAPKDGTKVLAICEPRHIGPPSDGKSMGFTYMAVVWWRKAKDPQWDQTRWKHALNDSYAEPTHWMPLPSPPDGD